MSDLLKEAIADAKAVRETALQNAKMALEEAFTPQLKSMLSAKLKEDDMEERDMMDDDDEDKDKTDEQSTSSGIGKGTSVKQASASDEEDPGKGKTHEQVEKLQGELNEYKEAVTFLRDKLHEVNILNAKLLYTNKLFKEFVLSNDQKLKIVETFDRAQTTREIKLVYSTLAESYKDNGGERKEVVKESYASKKSGGTAPKTKIITEESQVADRFRKLAGLKS